MFDLKIAHFRQGTKERTGKRPPEDRVSQALSIVADKLPALRFGAALAVHTALQAHTAAAAQPLRAVLVRPAPDGKVGFYCIVYFFMNMAFLAEPVKAARGNRECGNRRHHEQEGMNYF